MSQALLVPLDGSTHAELVLPWALYLARAQDWQIHLVQAARLPTLPSAGMLGEEMTPQMYDEILRAETGGATEYLDGVRQRLLPEAPDVQAVVRIGPVAEVILDLTDELGAAAIVMASHVHSGFMRALLGSVAEHIVHEATVPVLVVRAPTDQAVAPPALDRILVPLDGSTLSEGALDLASDLVPEEAGTLLLVRAEQATEQVVPTSDTVILYEDPEATAEAIADDRNYLTRIVAERSRAGLSIVPVTAVDGASDAILRTAREQRASLIVMSGNVHRGASRLFHGSVADQVLRHAEVPVLLVSARALAAQVVGHALVRDVMTRDLTTVGADEPLIVAMRKLLRRRVSGAPVVDNDGNLVGVLSEADLLAWQSKLTQTLIAEDALAPSEYVRRLSTETVRSVMAHPVTTVTETVSVLEILPIFEDGGPGRLPVVSDDKLVGIVTRSDVLWMMLRQSVISAGEPAPSEAGEASAPNP